MNVYLKTKNDGIWEKNPHIAFGISMILGLIIFFGVLFGGTFLDIPFWIIGLILFFIFASMVAIPVYLNAIKNQTKNIGFILDETTLYMVKLGYMNEINGSVINTPGHPIAQTMLLKHNLDVATETQEAEREIRERRNNEESYISAVEYKKAGNTGLPRGVIEFWTMKNPKIEKETKNKIWISYDANKNREMRTFRNVYGNLTSSIKELESKIGTTETAIYSPMLKKLQIYDIKSIILIIFGMVISSILGVLGVHWLIVSILFIIIEMILWKIFMKENTQ